MTILAAVCFIRYCGYKIKVMWQM